MNDRFRVYPVNISYEPDDTDVPYLVTIPLFDGVTQGGVGRRQYANGA